MGRHLSSFLSRQVPGDRLSTQSSSWFIFYAVPGYEQHPSPSFLGLRVGRTLLRWGLPVEKRSTWLLGCPQRSPQPEDLVAFQEEHPPHRCKQSRRVGRPAVPQGSLASVPSGSSFVPDSSSCYGNY